MVVLILLIDVAVADSLLATVVFRVAMSAEFDENLDERSLYCRDLADVSFARDWLSWVICEVATPTVVDRVLSWFFTWRTDVFTSARPLTICRRTSSIL